MEDTVSEPFFFSFFEQDNIPNLTEDVNLRGWIPYDFDNLLPQRLVDLYCNSVTHASIINKKVMLAQGEDIEVSQNLKWLENELDKGDGLYNLFGKLATDLFLFNGFAVEIIYKEYMNEVADIVHIPYQMCRVGISDYVTEDNKKEEGIWVSKDWQKPTYKNKPTFFKKYNWKKEEKSTIFYFKKHNPLSSFYPIPSYFSAYNSILTEVELIKYTKSLILNSFTPSGVLELSNITTPKQSQKLQKELENNFVGGSNAGKVMVVPAIKENTVKFTPFNNTPADKSVEPLRKMCESDIILAHEVASPTIIGLAGGASLGGDGSSIEQGRKLFMESVILPCRRVILDKLQDILNFGGYSNSKIEVKESIQKTETETE